MNYSVTGQLKSVPPFDLAQSLNFLGLFPPTQQEQSLNEQSLTKAICLQGQVIAFQVKSVGSVEAPQLAYTLFSDRPITTSTEQAAVDRFSFFLSLADDLGPFYVIGRNDPPFAPIIEQLYGYHQVKFLTPFENACWAMLSQRNPMVIARKMKQALTTRFGGSITVAGAIYWAFPEPAQLADVDPTDLAVLLHNARRAEYLSAAVRAFAAVDESFLRTAPFDEVKAWLQSIKGIGAWSADFILLRGLGRMEHVPVTEKRLFEVASKVYGPDQSLNNGGLQKLADRYGSWQGYWAHYLRVAAN